MTTENQVVAAGNNVPAVVNASNYIALAIQAKVEGFLAANEGLDLDYVRMGSYLKISKKGNFVESHDDTVSYGDNIDVVVAKAEKRWTLWGAEKSPEEGQLIVADRDEAVAKANLENWLANNPDAYERYSIDDLQLRLLAYIVPVRANGQVMLHPDQAPTIYLMSFAQGDTFGFGQYAMSIFDGKYKTIGVAGGTGANKVVTRLTTEERDRKGSTDTFLGIKFECLGVFNPADYGIEIQG
ncbi:hypothetical protein [Paenibacillus sp. BK720]|uniref:hypothetical protein n=1 Tax=Paenibacillus sp. BK720 TaxID=2587092 RepID=UPI001420DAD0|nr:hypothetical protein [Paenibacillus sp. BK720]NIK67905.1 hypothetical protein [Paenibacillus sp. BK720]